MTKVIHVVVGSPLYRGSLYAALSPSLSLSLQLTHTHIYIYLYLISLSIYIYLIISIYHICLSLACCCPDDSAQLLFVDGRILGGLVDITLPRFSSSSSSLLYLYSRLRAVLVFMLQVH